MRPLLGLIALVVVAILVSALVSSQRPHVPDSETDSTTPQTDQTSKPAAQTMPKANDPEREKKFDAVKDGAIKATMVVENRGTIVMELYPKAAPKTVAHFVELCKKHFYDGIKFHRVEPGFVVQGGDPATKNVPASQFESVGAGTHGSGQMVPLEANLPHLPATVGLARSQEPDSGDSQFYINLKDNGDSLDGKYCVFGRVIEGADIAPKIQIGDKITSLTVP